MSSVNVRVPLKLWVDTKANKVVFAEANKEFVDFLLHMLSLPLATVVKLLKDEAHEGTASTLAPLYRSVESLGPYFEPNLNKDIVLKPKVPIRISLLSLNDYPSSFKFFLCEKHGLATDISDVSCRRCDYCPRKEVRYVYDPPQFPFTAVNGITGYVKASFPYMVMDNLEVKPMSITLIKSRVSDLAFLKEQDVEVSSKEGLAILKASLQTKEVLTTVFLKTKA